ncbi:MAG: hypothetical protein ABH865_06015 [Candidatus Omnitrophota bacterium]|nr:hypothetical protein [Candidatus Omnitrophota bacterium]
MKQILAGVIALVVCCGALPAYPLGTTLLDIRNGIFEEAKQVQSLLNQSKDAGLVVSMWDTCIISVTQLNGYFYMLGIFEKIKTEDLSEEPINYLLSWLLEIRKTNDMNIKSLEQYAMPVEAKTKAQRERIRGYFVELNKRIDREITKIKLLWQSVQVKRTPKIIEATPKR